MFTNKEQISQQLRSDGWVDFSISYIDKGVMTDTYKMTIGNKSYAVRCFPKGREWLAKVEYEYLTEFQKKGIKCPIPITYCLDKLRISYLVYVWIEGDTLRNFQGICENDDDVKNVCSEIVENYNKICQVSSRKYGRLAKGKIYEHKSWSRFLKSEILLSCNFFRKEKNSKYIQICDGMFDYVDKIPEPSQNLVWSDLSLDNIIIADKHLAGFIDFEGMISGDPYIGISYLKSQDPNNDITKKIIELYNPSLNEETKKLIDFYSIFRYIRLAPYYVGNTPNGSIREPLDDFLSYVRNVEEQFNHKCNNYLKKILKFMALKLTITIVTALLCLGAVLGTCSLYEPTLSNSCVFVKVDSVSNFQFSEELPTWFTVSESNDTLFSNKVMSDLDKKVLCSCIEADDSIKQTSEYVRLCQSIDELAYRSNTHFPKTCNLILLTFCIVFLGCCARTFYDFIGWECYKGGQDMQTWWPWYVFRPIMGVPITTFLLVAFRTSLFSSLFTTKDLNHYLVISFLAGFAMMEFLKMLRRTAKGLFGEDKE